MIVQRKVYPRPPDHLASREPWNPESNLWCLAWPAKDGVRVVHTDNCIRCPWRSGREYKSGKTVKGIIAEVDLVRRDDGIWVWELTVEDR